jgi:chitinase
MNTDKTSLENETQPSCLGAVSISSFVNQAKHKLIGYQAYYKDGSNKFFREWHQIENNIASNPLIDIKQVGKSY